MQILITGKNLDIGDALRAHVETRLGQLSERYFEGALRANVVVEKQRSRFISDCTLHLATGLVIQAHGEAGDGHPSFDAAAGHMEKQLRRYKQRLKDHHRSRKTPVSHEDAPSFVIAAADHGDDDEPKDLNPAVIAETVRHLPELTVGEAVMQLDLSTVPFVLFRNARDSGLNVVYRRPDGNIGWVDPGQRKSA
jgi:ribosomal subunit interface protein